MNEGQEYIVKRSDEDRANINWPLFFVQVQKEELLDFLEQHLDSLQPKNDLPDERVVRSSSYYLPYNVEAIENYFRNLCRRIRY